MLTKEQRRAAIKQAADRVMPGVAAVLASDIAIAKAKKEAWIQECMRIHNIGREKAEKKYASMKRHNLV